MFVPNLLNFSLTILQLVSNIACKITYKLQTVLIFIFNLTFLSTCSFTGIPLAVHGGRPSSRASSQRSVGTIASGFSRRPSSGGSRGVLVPASRAGAARAAAILLISCHLTTTTATAASDQTSTDDNSQPDQEQQQQQQRIGKLSPCVVAFPFSKFLLSGNWL